MRSSFLALAFLVTGFPGIGLALHGPGRFPPLQEAPTLAGLYHNACFGYEISYPEGWRLVEAAPRQGPGTRRAAEVLSGDELQKVTFLEPGDRVWPGEFRIRVLANPRGLSLDGWTEEYSNTDMVDPEGGSLVTDMRIVSLAEAPARRLEVFLFDHTGVDIVTVRGACVFLLSYVSSTPNDPDLEEHRRVSEAMVRSFRFLYAEPSPRLRGCRVEGTGAE
jgi:hypothetical protein